MTARPPTLPDDRPAHLRGFGPTRILAILVGLAFGGIFAVAIIYWGLESDVAHWVFA